MVHWFRVFRMFFITSNKQIQSQQIKIKKKSLSQKKVTSKLESKIWQKKKRGVHNGGLFLSIDFVTQTHREFVPGYRLEMALLKYLAKIIMDTTI